MKSPLFSGSLSVRQGSRRVRFELAKAEVYGGPAGCYRVRVDRVWHDLDGKPAFLTPCLLYTSVGKAHVIRGKVFLEDAQGPCAEFHGFGPIPAFGTQAVPRQIVLGIRETGK